VLREQHIVERACALLDASPHSLLTLTQLSDAVHVSPFHLQRVFKRVTGLSPRQYQAAQRGAALRGALQRGDAVTRAAIDAGYHSPSRLYRAAANELGMTPSAYRHKGADTVIHYAAAATSLGFVLIAATDQGICRIAFGDEIETLIHELRQVFANAEIHEDPARIAPFIAQIHAYLQGSRQTFELPLDIASTAFQQRVWAALQSIPYGQTRTYTQIAAMAGAPEAVRAVASACAANPIALVIACHRAIRKGGALAGYRWGLWRKAALLATESQAFQADEPVLKVRDKRA
jgi:AraC family transcriptional regulator of adaptative response/methylated-DNA-[protein]-cysteine methyltransferase